MRGVTAHGLNRARQGAVKTAMQVAPRIGSIRPEIQEILPLILSGGAFYVCNYWIYVENSDAEGGAAVF